MEMLITILRALVEVAGFALLGQGALYVLAGSRREQNFIYQTLRMIASPAVKAMRAILPRAIVDRHVAIITFFVLLWLWLALQWMKVNLQ